jgi:hypothetical protein
MSRRTLSYQSPVFEPSGWGSGDRIFLGSVLVYAAFNVMLVVLTVTHANPPWNPFYLLLAVSAFGVIAAFPIQLAFRRARVTWRSAVAVLMCFLVLSGINFWCLICLLIAAS